MLLNLVKQSLVFPFTVFIFKRHVKKETFLKHVDKCMSLTDTFQLGPNTTKPNHFGVIISDRFGERYPEDLKKLHEIRKSCFVTIVAL